MTRADTLATLKGITVNNSSYGGGMPQYRGIWLGTIFASGSNVTEQSMLKSYVSNAYNRVETPMQFVDTGTHAYGTATWRQWANSAASAVQLVNAYAWATSMNVFSFQTDTGTFSQLITVGVDSTTPYISLSTAKRAQRPQPTSFPAPVCLSGPESAIIRSICWKSRTVVLAATIPTAF